MDTPTTRFSSVAIFILILLLPLSIWLERNYVSAWSNRLAFPPSQDEPNRHTPLITNGTFLPLTINKPLTLTAQNNPIILSSVTTVTGTGSLAIERGVTVMVHEHGQLLVDGKLILNGTATEPVTFLTNESHSANKVWGGIILNPASTGTIQFANFEHASPAITCLNTNKITVSHSTIKYANQDTFNPQGSCDFVN